MRRVQKSVLVPYSAAQMFSLVDRIEDYPQFLPWCGGSTVQRAGDTVDASIEIHFLSVRQRFATRNHNRPPAEIAVRLQDGPFSTLEGAWRFTALKADACKVELDLQYGFASATLAALVGPVFDHIADTLIDAFTQRAEVCYAH